MPSAVRLLRVDLSAAATDFRYVATEPGLPLLDRAGANYLILRRWLGRYLAEPQWIAGDSVNFFAQNGEGGRVSPLACLPVEREDLAGALKSEWETLRTKLRGIKPADKAERALLDAARRATDALVDSQKSIDPNYCLFKCREPGQPWRLVWCWGYQRADLQPATAVICTNADCNQLFLRRPQSDGHCPGCAKTGGALRARPRRGSRRLAALLLLLLLVGGAAACWSNRLSLEVRPKAWEGPVGSRADFQVTARRWFFWTDDITAMAQPLSHDTRVVQFARPGCVGAARGPGHTLVSFCYADRAINADVRVTPGEGVASLRVEPDKLTLAVGSTVQLKATAADAQGHAHDVSPAVQWELVEPSLARVRDGRLEALAAGQTWIVARYSPQPDEPPLNAEASLEVRPAEYRSLEISTAAAAVDVGQNLAFTVSALDQAGKSHDVTGAAKLKIVVAPDSVAKLEQDHAHAIAPGKAEIRAEWGEVKAVRPFEVRPAASAAPRELRVAPQDVALAVGERFELDVLGRDESPIETSSADPKVVEVVGSRELIGRGAGETTVRLAQGSSGKTIRVRVSDAKVESLRIEPASISLSIGGKGRVRVLGQLADQREIAIAPTDLTWSRQPQAAQVDFDRRRLELTGLAPTGDSQELTVSYQKLEATAEVSVQGSPATQLADDFMPHPPLLSQRIGVGEKPVADSIGVAADSGRVATPGGVTVVDSNRVATSGGAHVVVGPYLGQDLVLRDGALVVGDVAPKSVLAEAGVPAGAVIVGVDGRSLDKLSPTEIHEHFSKHPLAAGTRLRYRTADGKLAEAHLGDRMAIVRDVTVASIKFRDLMDKKLTAEIEVAVREPGEYRISDAAGAPLGDWRALARDSVGTFSAKQIPRTPNDEYELYVDRRIGNETKRFQIPFRLTQEQR